MALLPDDRERLLGLIGRSVPRYTSYPTAPHFLGDVDAARYAAWLDAVGDRKAPISLYLHVPFCRALCFYCGCATKATLRDGPIEAYVALLRRELAMVAAHTGRVPVSHIHWGGGTPSLVAPELMAAIAADIAELFEIGPNTEHAIEIDPRHLTAAGAAAMAAAGINRASLGIQDFEPEVQAAIGRPQPLETVEAAVSALRDAGITALNFDLIYGLPHQTTDSIRRSAETATRLEPSRISLFGYAHVPWFRPHQKKIDATTLPGSAARLDLELTTRETIEAHGYRSIGIDHFARQGDELTEALDRGSLRRNFQGYTTDAAETLIGVGATSIGRTPWGYVQNLSDTKAWEAAVSGGALPVMRGHVFVGDDLLRAEVIERILCFFAVDLGEVAARHGADPADLLADLVHLDDLVADGWVTVEAGRVAITAHQRELARLVAAAFDPYLAKGGRHSVAV